MDRSGAHSHQHLVISWSRFFDFLDLEGTE
jgi:hypothetical protein